MKKKEINSHQIARLAGVSRSTVSRVINNYSNVPAETREKVMKVIEQYNYFPDLSGQVLAGKKTRTIGLFMIEAGHVSGDMISNFLLANVVETASSQGYYVLTQIIRDSRDPEAIRSVKESFYQRRIDGGLFIGAANHEPMIEELIAEGFAVGLVDHLLPGRQEPNRIVYNFDNAGGIDQAIDYLANMNHRHIGVIKGDMKRHSGPDKFNGFLLAMKRRNLAIRPEWVLEGDFHQQAGYEAVERMLEGGGELPTAIFAANDSVAFGAIDALHKRGLRVPDDISLIGFDDHTLSARIQPSLTTIRVDFGEVMGGLTRALIAYIERGGDTFKRVTVGTKLIVRESCRQLST
ncbi:LacI family transcriptional regulator [Xylanibacillus composti]|uniref:LacI family transcriptional regulator n=1 Tax=Xylanibacillus composti TaxID=1572762 RepID=A0A8J4H0S5_9BACL|nr:LacI family DNA-binding transcriptional regulator [Xylanibacillus composti]MDT9725126.1 LacI family transcriptional regulator [Xylanibacillus composti]GIQ67301.1 LacI family transcriptional regulator [Xylanibacillus composti]